MQRRKSRQKFIPHLRTTAQMIHCNAWPRSRIIELITNSVAVLNINRLIIAYQGKHWASWILEIWVRLCS
jgi:hypothetical protein